MVMLLTRYVDPNDRDARSYVKIDGSEFPVPKPNAPNAHRQLLDLAALAALDATGRSSRSQLIRLAIDAYVATYDLEATKREER
jgi:hypothetical protein